MSRILLIRLEGPLQAWGAPAIDTTRPTHPFPTLSALAGLIASALGWRYRDGERTTQLQDALSYAVREDRPGTVLWDFQTADLERIGSSGWTRWGVEKRGGGKSREGTQILNRQYLADASFLVAAEVGSSAPIGADEIHDALSTPARPLFLGRRSCPPSEPLAQGCVDADSPYELLATAALADRSGAGPFRCWYPEGGGPPAPEGAKSRVWDRRDFQSDRHAGSRRIVESTVTITGTDSADG